MHKSNRDLGLGTLSRLPPITMVQDGILVWANTIRRNMINDPGRKYFQEQIQSHGFQFLENYLNEIEQGGGQE